MNCKIIIRLIAAHNICEIECIMAVGALGGNKTFDKILSNAVIVVATVSCTIELDLACLKIFSLQSHLNNFRSAS
jgi:hypothetical protein